MPRGGADIWILRRTNPRKFRQLLTFERNLGTRDASGGFGWTPETVCVVKGSLEPLAQQGVEYFRADRTVALNQYMATIYRRADIDERLRISYNGRFFYITQAPQVDRADRFMMIFCEETRA